MECNKHIYDRPVAVKRILEQANLKVRDAESAKAVRVAEEALAKIRSSTRQAFSVKEIDEMLDY